ncbi:MAG TPA: phosphate ABC transporter permease subunit PstC [Anaerolineales bacterium]|nr:phosphate ABC transporter permease subunit PstC [Anaerolineales bacterium]
METRLNSTPPSNWSRRLQKRIGHGDLPWQGLIVIASALVMLIILGIAAFLWRQSSGTITKFGWSFVAPTADPNWDPINDNFQAWPFIYGTILTSVAAMILAVPISLGIAVFVAELCPEWLRTPLNWLVEMLAAIPSVIYGLWGLFVFLPVVTMPVGKVLGNTLGKAPLLSQLFGGPIPESGASRLGAALILSIMVIPTISAVTRDVLLAIPSHQREAALALGATRWEMIWQVLLPYGLSGILGADLIGLGRALGETMAVTMVIGNSLDPSPSLLRPGYTMASVIANEFAEAVSKIHVQALMEVGLALFLITLALNILARLLVWSVARRTPQEVRA